MFSKLREKINIFIAKSPRKAVLIGIMILNIVFIMVSATVIYFLSKLLSGVKDCSFGEAIYNTVTMILDAGCITNVIQDIGQAGAFAGIVCITVIILGMIFFTGAVIGYVTNVISDFIDSKNNGKNKLVISDHIVIINWNSRVSAIIREYLFERKEQIIVVFVPDGKDEIDEVINRNIDFAVETENASLHKKAAELPFFERQIFLSRNLLQNRLTIIVREGDVSAQNELNAVCIGNAKTVIIMEQSDIELADKAKGNPQTIKNLIQVAELSHPQGRTYKQTIVVEVADDWTEKLVEKIVEFKKDVAYVVPVKYNVISGKLLALSSIIPELFYVYSQIFSNKAPFLSLSSGPVYYSKDDENTFLETYLNNNNLVLPLTVMDSGPGNRGAFLVSNADDISEISPAAEIDKCVSLKKNVHMHRKHIIVIGHNSNMKYLMDSFLDYNEISSNEIDSPVLSVVVLDGEDNLERNNYYKDYPFVEKTLAAGLFDEDSVAEASRIFSQEAAEDTSILILSDDDAEEGDVDAGVITCLIYLHELIHKREEADPKFDRSKLNILVEVLNPKNIDVVRAYDADTVIYANSFISEMIARIGSEISTASFYHEILLSNPTNDSMQQKSVFIKTVQDFFKDIPEKTTAEKLVRMVYAAGEDNNKSILMGYIRGKTDFVYFAHNQSSLEVELQPDDKLIIFSNY